MNDRDKEKSNVVAQQLLAENDGADQGPTVNPVPESKARAPLFVCNLLLFLVIGISVSFWLIHYTDDFESVASAFALTGAFSWLAFISKVLPEARLKCFQAAFDRTVLSNGLTTIFLVIIAVLFTWIGLHRGTVEIESREATTDRIIQVFKNGKQQDEDTLKPNQRVRFALPTSPFLSASFVLHVPGYPNRTVQIHPWELVRLRVPTSFYREVVLLKPKLALIDQRAQGLRLKVRLKNRQAEAERDFDGFAVWLGGNEDLVVPSGLQDQWREDLKRDLRPLAIKFLTQPVSLNGSLSELRPDDQVCVELMLPNSTAYTHTEFEVKRFQHPLDFPQVEELDDRDATKPDPPHC